MHEYGLSFARSLFWRTLPRVVGMLPKPINCAEIVIKKLPRVVPQPLGQWRTSAGKGNSLLSNPTHRPRRSSAARGPAPLSSREELTSGITSHKLNGRLCPASRPARPLVR